MHDDPTRGLPTELASLLRDQSVLVSKDAAVFELIAAWAKAPTHTLSAEVPLSEDTDLLEALARHTNAVRSTTGISY